LCDLDTLDKKQSCNVDDPPSRLEGPAGLRAQQALVGVSSREQDQQKRQGRMNRCINTVRTESG